MNSYELKKKSRIEYYEEQAEKLEKQSKMYCNSNNINAVIGMQGEPIKIGHHSEKRHRRLIEKAENDMKKSFELSQKAEYYREKAEAAELNTSIYSDDPNAIEKLEKKLKNLMESHELMKKINAEYKKCKGDIDKMTIPSEKIKQQLKIAKEDHRYSTPYKPFTGYTLQNSNTKIRNTKKRIEKLKKSAQDVTTQWEIGDITIVDNVEENRVQIFFPDKPSDEIRTKLKRHGFRWARRTEGTPWQRHRSKNALYLANEIIEQK